MRPAIAISIRPVDRVGWARKPKLGSPSLGVRWPDECIAIVVLCTSEASLMRTIFSIRFLALVSAGASLGAQVPAPTTAVTADLGLVSATGNTRLQTLNIGDKVVR